MGDGKESQTSRGQLATIVASTSKQTKNNLSLQLRVSVILCIFGFPLFTRGYSNVIDELCMRAQLPLYSPRDYA
jgi:hypothetical protein